MDADNHSIPDATGCEEAWALVQRFVSRGLSGGEDEVMRAHLERCGECRDRYRAAVVTTARIGHERRVRRAADERRARRERLRRLAFEAPGPSRGRLHRVRTLLYPAFFCFLMIQVGRLTTVGPRIELTPLSGRVEIAGSSFGAEDPPTVLTRGDWCLTGPAGEARIATRQGTARLLPETLVLVERSAPARLRLLRGELELSERCTVTSQHGVLDVVGGSAHVRVRDGRLEVESRTGDVTFTGPDGVRRVPAGDRLAADVRPSPADPERPRR